MSNLINSPPDSSTIVDQISDVTTSSNEAGGQMEASNKALEDLLTPAGSVSPTGNAVTSPNATSMGESYENMCKHTHICKADFSTESINILGILAFG